jgi:hypothetical protein
VSSEEVLQGREGLHIRGCSFSFCRGQVNTLPIRCV